jgi:hypothetical protein
MNADVCACGHHRSHHDVIAVDPTGMAQEACMHDGVCTCDQFTPESREPDPMDEAAFRMLNPADGPGEFARVVYLDTAKRLRDDAVEHAFAQGAAHAVAGANETAAALIAGIDQALEQASTASMRAAGTILDGEFGPKPVKTTATWAPVPEPGPDDTPPVGMVEIDVPDPDECPIGIEHHTWRVTIEENCLTYEPVEKCTGACHPDVLGGVGVTDYIEAELGLYRFRWWGCDNPGGWHYDQPCDCDQGWTLDRIPVLGEIEETD